MFKKVSFLKLGGRDVKDGRAQTSFAPIGGVMHRVNLKNAEIYIDTVSE